MKKFLKTIKPWFPSFLLFPVMVLLILNQGKFIPIVDHINLLIHEGGHGVFSVFGKFIHALGGTLMQLIIPSMFIVFYIWKKKRISLQIALIYLAQNLMNISVYVSDARAKQLPLLGGKKVYHDWAYLLGELNLLESDIIIGEIIFFVSVAVLLFSLFVPMIFRDYRKVNINLDL